MSKNETVECRMLKVINPRTNGRTRRLANRHSCAMRINIRTTGNNVSTAKLLI